MLNLQYDFNNVMAERVGEHGIADAELRALGPKLAAAAAARVDFGDLTALLYAQGYKREEFAGD